MVCCNVIMRRGICAVYRKQVSFRLLFIQLCTGTSMLLLVETGDRLDSPCIIYVGSVRIMVAPRRYLRQEPAKSAVGLLGPGLVSTAGPWPGLYCWALAWSLLLGPGLVSTAGPWPGLYCWGLAWSLLLGPGLVSTSYAEIL
jgi:hypothetical protein